jgi:hypothetical protein
MQEAIPIAAGSSSSQPIGERNRLLQRAGLGRAGGRSPPPAKLLNLAGDRFSHKFPSGGIAFDQMPRPAAWASAWARSSRAFIAEEYG